MFYESFEARAKVSLDIGVIKCNTTLDANSPIKVLLVKLNICSIPGHYEEEEEHDYYG